MFRTHTCGELNLQYAGQTVTLAGWVQRIRKMGGMTFVDLRDRYGITQLVFSDDANAELCEKANALGREFVVQATGLVSLEGDIPSPANPPKGCRFHTRCPYAREVCKHVPPEYREYGNGHFAACHLLEEQENG